MDALAGPILRKRFCCEVVEAVDFPQTDDDSAEKLAFTFEDQLQLFRSYHVNDNALKSEIMRKMEDETGNAASSILVLQGASFLATSKVDSRKVPLSPGPRPSIRLVETVDGGKCECGRAERYLQRRSMGSQAGNWIGHAIAEVLGLDVDRKADREQVTRVLRIWIEKGALATQRRPDDHRKMRTFVIAGPEA